MFVQPLLLSVAGLLIFLWLADAFLTIRVAKKIGSHVELNPIIRLILSFRGKFFPIFKLVEIIVFGATIFFVATLNNPYALYLMYILIIVYGLLVSQGLSVYSKIFSDSKPIIFTFIILILFALFFINLSYSIFYNSTKIAEETNNCGNAYAKLYSECKGTPSPTNYNVNPFDFNIVLPEVD